MIAFNPKPEIASTFYHFIVGLLVVIKLFHVIYIFSNIATTNTSTDVKNIGYNYDHDHWNDR